MSRSAALTIGLAIVLVSAGFSAWIYPSVPMRIPVQWDSAGHASAYLPKLWGVWRWPSLIGVFWLVMAVFPALVPKHLNMPRSLKMINLACIFAMVAVFGISVAIVRSSFAAP